MGGRGRDEGVGYLPLVQCTCLNTRMHTRLPIVVFVTGSLLCEIYVRLRRNICLGSVRASDIYSIEENLPIYSLYRFE